jgi:ubiquinone/menaquinone biosynthesis C-methylase UbiE
VSDTFHQIAAIFPTEFIADPNTLSEIYRVLLPGGEVIVLLTAWIKGKSPSERLASWLFHFTGQAPEWTDQFLEPILKSGFQTRVEQLTVQSSVLLVIRAQKPINPISRGTN